MRCFVVQPLEPRLHFSGDSLGVSGPLNISLGGGADFITTADFNRDGKLDLVTSSYSARSLSLLKGMGGGHYSKPQKISLPSAPDFVTSADLDSDGSPDLVAVSFSDNRVMVLLGDGKGGFSVANYRAGTGPRAAVIADFNNDGTLDMAMAKSFDKTLTILRGKGDGTFAAAVNSALNFVPSDLVAADFDQDGNVDLAAVDFFDDRLYVLMGLGNGSFEAPKSFATRTGPTSITAADLNGNHHLDLITANLLSDNISIFMGHSDGNFDGGVNVAAGDGPTFVTSADLDNDQKADLLVLDAHVNEMTILLGVGDGSFGSRDVRASGLEPRDAVIADLNANGRLDIAVADQDTANQTDTGISLFLSDESGPTAALASAPVVSFSGTTTYGFSVQYSDDLLVDSTSLDGQDIMVSGPNGFSTAAAFVSCTNSGSRCTASYRVNAPGGVFKPSGNGQYTISLKGGQVRDSAGNFVAARQLGTFNVNAIDASNSRVGAQSLGKVTTGRARKMTDYVGIDDTNDWFTFAVPILSRVTGTLSSLTDDADMQLFDAESLRLVNLKHMGTAAETFVMDLLPGVYFLRVVYSRGSRGTGYSLRLDPAASALAPSNDDRIATARSLGGLKPGKSFSIVEIVGATDPADYHKFLVASNQTINLSVALSELNGDADLQLLSTSGAILTASSHPGTARESLASRLSAGTYILRVLYRARSRGTYYRLTFTPT